MLIIEVKENEGIDRALKRYKRKFRDAKVLDQLRRRQYFEKPSISRRKQIKKAAYREQIRMEKENS